MSEAIQTTQGGEVAAPTPKQKLVTWSREATAARVQQQGEIAAARAAASGVGGIVITNDAEAAIAADTAKTIADGRKKLTEVKRAASEIPKAMIEAAGEVVDALERELAAADAEIKAASLGHLKRKRAEEVASAKRREEEQAAAAAEEQRRREEAAADTRAAMERAGAPAEAVEQAAQQAASAVVVVPLEDPPPAPVAPPRGGKGQLVPQRTMKAEIVNLADVDPAFVTLRVKDACDYARVQMRFGEMPEPGIATDTDEAAKRTNGVVYRGVRYYYVETMSSRGL